MFIGIDIGTQALKVSVLDQNLTVRGAATRTYSLHCPQPGWAEQDPRDWEAALGPAIADALVAAKARPGDVVAMGICGQLDGCIAVDGNGAPLATCLTWMDRRAAAEIADIPAALVRDICGQVLDPSHLAAKARWLKRHNPDARRAAIFHQPVSYMVMRLTGHSVIDHALASTSMCYDLDRARYHPDLLTRFELQPSELPPVAAAGDIAGRLNDAGAALSGLPKGLPVAVGTGDDFATPLGGGLTAPGRAAIVIGTGEVVGGLHPSPLRDAGALVETHAYPSGAYFIENPGWLSGGALLWLGSILGLDDFAAMDELAALIPPGADGLIFLPALTGAMAPRWQPQARGCFHGLTPAHGRGHMIRAVLEGCSFAMLDVLRHFADMGVAAESLLLLGGGARSALWAQIRADVAARPVEIPAEIHGAPIGAALLAATAAGRLPDIAATAQALQPNLRHFTPNPQASVAYKSSYRAYRDLFDRLYPAGSSAGSSSEYH